VSAAEIQRFTGAPVAAPPPPATAPRHVPAGNLWTGRIAEVREKSGEKNGKPWTLYMIKGADAQEFRSFDTNHANFARAAGKLDVEIHYELSEKNTQMIVSIGPGKDLECEPGVEDEP
jgi:hypothetical protein